MIQISLTSALVFYSGVLAALVLVIWLYTEITVRHSQRVLEKQNLWRCVFCGYIYLDEQAAVLSKCPRCDSYSSIEDEHARYVRVRAPESAADQTAQDAERARNTSRRKRPHQRRRGPRKR